MISEHLTDDFIAELLAYGLHSRNIMSVICKYLRYEYLQHEEQKVVVRWLVNQIDHSGQVPTIAQMQQGLASNSRALDFIASIKHVEVSTDTAAQQSVLATFEQYLKQMMFLASNDRIVQAWNSGNKEAAYNAFVTQAEQFSKFSLIDAEFETVFGDFNSRMIQRRSDDYNAHYRIGTMIDQLDLALGGDSGYTGGAETGEFCLWLGASGIGKSFCLIHLGVAAARQGYKVAHFQLEGTKQQCLDRYDAAWTGILYHDMKMADVTRQRIDALGKIITHMRQHDIYVHACEQWGGMTLDSIHEAVEKLQRSIGHIDMIIIDYLELLETGDGHRYTPGEERFRQQRLARGMKALAMEFNCVVHTATQSNDITLEQRNDPEFVLSRNNLNEDRGKLRPADVFITLNATLEEQRNHIMRLFIDKAREHAGGQIIRIVNSFKNSRFYDRRATVELQLEDE